MKKLAFFAASLAALGTIMAASSQALAHPVFQPAHLDEEASGDDAKRLLSLDEEEDDDDKGTDQFVLDEEEDSDDDSERSLTFDEKEDSEDSDGLAVRPHDGSTSHAAFDDDTDDEEKEKQ